MDSIQKQLKAILNITKYSIRMFFRDKTAIFFSLFVPLLIMTIFGVLNLDKASKVRVGVVDEAKNQLSVQMVDSLKKIDVLAISEGEKEAELSEIKDSNLDLVLILPKDFGSSIAMLQSQKLLLLAQNKQDLAQNIEVYVNKSQTNGSVQIGLTVLDKVFDGITHQTTGTPSLFVLEQKSIESVKLSYIDFIIPGVAAMSIMQLSIFGAVGAMVSWRERGILKRLLATPIKPSNIIFSQVVTRLIITLLQVCVLMGIGMVLFNLQVVGNFASILFISVLGGIVFLSIGLTASGLASTQNSVMAIANLIMMPQMFLSGVFFPRDALPPLLQTITGYFPLTYLSDAMRQVMIHGATLFQIRYDLIGLLVWGMVLFFVSTKFFRWE